MTRALQRPTAWLVWALFPDSAPLKEATVSRSSTASRRRMGACR